MKVTILSGVPGSGKSTWCKSQVDSEMVSADDYLPKDPKPADFGIAHAKCMNSFLDYVRYSNYPHVIVDNTNTTAVEIAPYYLAAQAEGAEIVILRFECIDYEEAFRQNIHKVPFKTFCIMTANFLKRDVMPWWNVETR